MGTIKTIKGKEYVIDTKKLFEFVFSSEEDKLNDTDITQQYANDEENDNFILTNKVISEKKYIDTSRTGIRYDLMKSFIISLIDVHPELNQFSLGEGLIFNTLLDMKIIREK
jgi:hypothetical protein